MIVVVNTEPFSPFLIRLLIGYHVFMLGGYITPCWFVVHLPLPDSLHMRLEVDKITLKCQVLCGQGLICLKHFLFCTQNQVTLSGSWAAEISLLKSGISTLPTLQSEVFSDRVSIVKPIRALIVVTKTESNCCELHLKTSEEDKGLLSMDAAILAVLSDLDGIHIKITKTWKYRVFLV